MSRLIETICVIDGKIQRKSYHLQRMNAAAADLFGNNINLNLDAVEHLATHCPKGKYKCRLIYMKDILDISFQLYTQLPIKSLKVVFDDQIEYQYKYEDRTIINNLFAKKEEADDVLIVKYSRLTDTSYCNIGLYDGDQWWTPSSPLLKGTKRSYYIKKGVMSEKEIHYKELNKYQKITLFNAMIDAFEIEIKMDQVSVSLS